MSNQPSLTTFRRQTKQILFVDNVCLLDRKKSGQFSMFGREIHSNIYEGDS